MKRIRLKKRPSFYEDLVFSHWLTKDKLLAVVLDRHSRVEEVRLDPSFYPFIVKELKSRAYL